MKEIEIPKGILDFFHFSKINFCFSHYLKQLVKEYPAGSSIVFVPSKPFARNTLVTVKLGPAVHLFPPFSLTVQGSTEGTEKATEEFIFSFSTVANLTAKST